MEHRLEEGDQQIELQGFLASTPKEWMLAGMYGDRISLSVASAIAACDVVDFRWLRLIFRVLPPESPAACRECHAAHTCMRIRGLWRSYIMYDGVTGTSPLDT